MTVRTAERIALELEAAKSQLAQLEADADKPFFWNRAYPLIVSSIPLMANNVSFAEFVVDQGTTFYAKSLEAHYIVSGTLAEDSSPATITIPETVRSNIFDFTWMIRDSGTARDWGNLPLPSSIIMGGNINALDFMNGQAFLPGGSKVTLTINATRYNAAEINLYTGLSAVDSHSLRVVMTGIAVRDGAL